MRGLAMCPDSHTQTHTWQRERERIDGLSPRERGGGAGRRTRLPGRLSAAVCVSRARESLSSVSGVWGGVMISGHFCGRVNRKYTP